MNRPFESVAAEKIAQAVALLNDCDIDAWLILSREGTDSSFELMTGQRSIHQAICLIHREGAPQLFSSQSDYESYAQSGLFDVQVYETSLEDVLTQALDKAKPKRLALNISQDDALCDGLTLGQYMWLAQALGAERLRHIEVSSEVILSPLRSIKTDSEIACVTAAVSHTIDIFDEVFGKMRSGMTEIDVGNLFVDSMKHRGVTSGLGAAFDPPLVCAVKRGLAHRKPTDYVLKQGDIVIIDASVRYQQYVSDIARTCYIAGPNGSVPSDVQHAFDTAVAAISKGIEALQPGKRGYEVDEVARKHIETSGYPSIRHAVGHQVGRACHDGGTVLGPRRDTSRPQVEGVIQPGQIYAMEPTVIQDDGLPCVLVEEDVLVTAMGNRVLSRRQMDLVVIRA